MRTFAKAIEEFRDKRLGVYKADNDQIVRDTRVAERATKDHVGRWLFELLQNSDDAGASNCNTSKVRILIVDDTIYVADNGNGLKPEAVSAICGTDFSDKTIGTIGRKGVGFKSVYEISTNPQVLTVNGDGIEFNSDRAGEWLRQHGFGDEHVPYQWIPFFISWDEARWQDPVLDAFTDYKTVVRLPGVSQDRMSNVERLLKEWPPHALFAFRHVRKITAPHLEITLTPGDGVWELKDNRGDTPTTSWLVAKPSEPEYPPEKLLEPLGTDERKAIKENGVGFLIAAPLVKGCVTPTSDYLPVHVFYPTEQKGPVRLLLHAEFLVKSDRTVLIPIDHSPFNTWVAKSLASQVCRFVDSAFRRETPSSHVALLMPLEERESHPVADALWKQISEAAKANLRLADVEGDQRLTVDEARLVSVTVRLDLARKLLEATDVRRQLLHCTFDEHKDARKALKELGCGEIRDHGIMAVIVENAASRTADTDWIWACWEWLAAWVYEEPYGDKQRNRLEQVKELPLVPVAGQLLRPSDLASRIVTWKPDGRTEDLPDWLPLTFVDGWFRDCIHGISEQDSSIKQLYGELGIKEPGADVIQRAVGLAIVQYWKNRWADPLRFLHFISGQDWHETSLVSSKLKRCPVPLSRPLQGEKYAEARMAYFGRDWGNDLLAEFYDGIEAVAWIGDDSAEDPKGKLRRVLEWLGVADCPRVIKVEKEIYVWQLPANCGDWKKYLETARDTYGRRVEMIRGISGLEHLSVSELSRERALFLISLIARHWDGYYRNQMEIFAEGKQGRERDYRSWEVKAKWWWEVSEKLALPVRGGNAKYASLTQCWLPDKKTRQEVGDLLLVVDLEAFESQKEIVHNWLDSAVGLRTRIAQVTLKEWKDFLSTLIPALAPAELAVSDERLRDKVTRWYAACLETVAVQDNVPKNAFAACPLLCRKEDLWRYVGKEPRYLNDNNEFAKAFAGDAWLFHVASRITADAVKYFGIPSLSESIEVRVERGEPWLPLGTGLQVKFSDSLPYVWVWRSSKSKQDAESLPSLLKSLKVFVVPALKARLYLNGVCREVERRWNASENTIFLHEKHINEAELSQALAEAIGAKSEADFYENLLRCGNGTQRKEKLLSKGISEAEVERCLREYLERLEAEKLVERGRTEQSGEASIFPLSPTPNGGKQQPGGDHGAKTGKTQVSPAEGATPAKKPFCLKDARNVAYIVGGQPEVGTAPNGGGSGGWDASVQEAHLLTDKEKAELEEGGRRVATRELEKMGYVVEQMAANNPGFDLRCSRGGAELRVEVKAHMGKANVADVTQRQYKEYLGQQGYLWELWNVEHLAAQDARQVVITRYDVIPDDALDARTFRVDLKKCRSPANSP